MALYWIGDLHKKKGSAKSPLDIYFYKTVNFRRIAISNIKHVMYNRSMIDIIDDATKKVKNAEQDARAKGKTTEDHAEGKPSSETLNKAKEKVKDALT